MKKNGMHFLSKIFKKKEYMDDFLDGNLYMNCLGFFKNVEDSKNTQFDSKEAIKSYLQPDDLQIVIKFKDQIIHLDNNDLAGPLIIQNNGYNNLKIICFYSPFISYSDLSQSKEELKITEKMKEDFGEYAIVITNFTEFSNRLEIAIKNHKDIKACRHTKVDYFSDDFHGSFNDDEIPFKKHGAFSFQKEYRIVVRTEQHDENPLILNVGDIRDICLPFTIEQFNEIELKIKEEP